MTSEVAVAGDTVNDLVAGRRAGATDLAGVLTGAHDRAQWAAAPHTHLLVSVTGLPEVLEGVDARLVTEGSTRRPEGRVGDSEVGVTGPDLYRLGAENR